MNEVEEGGLCVGDFVDEDGDKRLDSGFIILRYPDILYLRSNTTELNPNTFSFSSSTFYVVKYELYPDFLLSHALSEARASLSAIHKHH